MSAKSIAEALAAAEVETQAVHHQHRVVVLNQHGTVSGDSDSLDLAEPQDWSTQFVRADVAEAALKHLAERLERAEERIAAVRAVEGRHVCDYVSQWGVRDDGCACVVCQVHDALVWDVAKEAKP